MVVIVIMKIIRYDVSYQKDCKSTYFSSLPFKKKRIDRVSM